MLIVSAEAFEMYTFRPAVYGIFRVCRSAVPKIFLIVYRSIVFSQLFIVSSKVLFNALSELQKGKKFISN